MKQFFALAGSAGILPQAALAQGSDSNLLSKVQTDGQILKMAETTQRLSEFFRRLPWLSELSTVKRRRVAV